MADAPRPELAALPRIDDLVTAAADLVARYGRRPVTAAMRRAVAGAREAMRAGDTGAADRDRIVAAATADLADRLPGPPRPVINAAGVIIHTNLGRAPLSDEALAAVAAAGGYCDLEYDISTGLRGRRDDRVDALLVELTGAEAGMAVNNAAAALVLTLATLAAAREVLVSRGELVEIGGSFRLPEIMAVSGARLVEVGTTNRTRTEDYLGGGDVGAILKVHPSNFQMTGFTAAPSVAELSSIARTRGIPLIHDVGSGLIRPHPAVADEPSVTASLEAGADLAICSGDKVLGGPQAGLIVGRADLVARCRTHPLARALRLDKLRIAGLVATLQSHLRDDTDAVPVWHMLLIDEEALERRAQVLAAKVRATVEAASSLVGGGTAPDVTVPSPVVRIVCADPARVTTRLRAGDPPIIVRVERDAVWVDLRTVQPELDDVVATRIAEAL